MLNTVAVGASGIAAGTLVPTEGIVVTPKAAAM